MNYPLLLALYPYLENSTLRRGGKGGVETATEVGTLSRISKAYSAFANRHQGASIAGKGVTERMIIAAIDLMRYLAARGRYSKVEIQRLGGTLASTDTIDVNNVDIGTPIFFHPRVSLFSWVIMYWTNGIWSHVATYSGKGQIIHAVSVGVVEEPLSNYLDNKSYLCILPLPGIPEDEQQRMLTLLRSQLGKGYAWGKAIWLGVLTFNNQADGYHVRLSADFLIILLAAAYLMRQDSGSLVALSTVFAIHVAVVTIGYMRGSAISCR